MRLPLELLIDRYQKNLFAAAYNVCANAQDAEDVVQDTFLQYYSTNKQFNDEEHIKAWLLRVAINKAKDVTRRFRWKNAVSLEDLNEDIPFEDPEVETFFDEVMKLPEKYRVAIHLFYYEEMSVREIAQCLGITEQNVKTRLSRARDQLREKMGGTER